MCLSYEDGKGHFHWVNRWQICFLGSVSFPDFNGEGRQWYSFGVNLHSADASFGVNLHSADPFWDWISFWCASSISAFSTGKLKCAFGSCLALIPLCSCSIFRRAENEFWTHTGCWIFLGLFFFSNFRIVLLFQIIYFVCKLVVNNWNINSPLWIGRDLGMVIFNVSYIK